MASGRDKKDKAARNDRFIFCRVQIRCALESLYKTYFLMSLHNAGNNGCNISADPIRESL
jgi:hypothetical protein